MIPTESKMCLHRRKEKVEKKLTCACSTLRGEEEGLSGTRWTRALPVPLKAHVQLGLSSGTCHPCRAACVRIAQQEGRGRGGLGTWSSRVGLYFGRCGRYFGRCLRLFCMCLLSFP